jgi:hypothetical protein
MPVDVQSGELVGVGDWFGQRLQRPEVGDPLVAVSVVELLVLGQLMQQMLLVPDQRAVQ